MKDETERHMIQIQETGDTPKLNIVWVDRQFPSPDIQFLPWHDLAGKCPDLKTEDELTTDCINPDYPCVPDYPPYSPPALEMDRLYRLQMDLANGLPIERNDTQALLNEILRLRGNAK